LWKIAIFCAREREREEEKERFYIKVIESARGKLNL